MPFPKRFTAFAAILLTFSKWTHAEWNQFRGPNGSGVADTDSRPPATPGDDNLAWKVTVPIGLSAPSLAGDRIFLTGVENGRLVTLALSRDNGRVLWRREAPEVPLEKVHETSSPAVPTPLADDKRVIVYFGSFGLLCYDHEGTELWKKPLPVPRSLYGTSCSPIAHRENAFLVLDDDENLKDSKLSRSRVIAFKKDTGEQVWETARPLVRSSWSTPIVWKHSSGIELVVLGSGRLTGYDLTTGSEKWHATGFSRETIAMPAAGGDYIYASSAQLGGGSDESVDPKPFWDAVMLFDSNKDGRLERGEMTGHFTFPLRPELPPGHPGFGIPVPSDPAKRTARLEAFFTGTDKNKDGFWTREEFFETMTSRPSKPLLVAIKAGAAGDAVATGSIAWELRRSIPEIPSPLLLDGRIYMVRNGGLFAAVDAATGKVIYTERLASEGQFSASPVAAAGRIYVISNRGKVTVVKSGEDFQKIHEFEIGEPVMVTPAIDRDTIYIRTEKALRAYRAKP